MNDAIRYLVLSSLLCVSLCKINCNCPTVFVLESSTSVDASAWNLVKSFTTTIVQRLQDGNQFQTAKAAVVTYSDTATTAIPFSNDASAIISGVQGLAKGQGISQTNLGIEQGAQLLQAETASCKTLILVTDGLTNSITASKAAADSAKKAGVEIVVVGVGLLVNRTQIVRLSSAPHDENALNIVDYGRLPDVANSLAGHCALIGIVNPEAQLCGCDIVIAVDIRIGGGTGHWSKIREMVKVIAFAYRSKMNSRQVRLGVVLRGAANKLAVPLTFDYNAAVTEVSRMEPVTSTSTSALLKFALKELLASQRQQLTCQQLILVTDNNTPSDDALQAAFDIKRKYSIVLKTVAIGDTLMTPSQAFTYLASRPLIDNQLVIQYDAAVQTAHKLADACDESLQQQVTKTLDPIRDDCQCDVYMVLDSSDSVSDADRTRVSSFAQTVVTNLKPYIAANGVRVAVNWFGSSASANQPTSDSATITNQMSSPRQTGSRNVAGALQSTKELLLANPTNSANCRTVYLVIAGAIDDSDSAPKAAFGIKSLGAKIVAIQLSTGALDMIRSIASSPADINAVNPTGDIAPTANAFTAKCSVFPVDPEVPEVTPVQDGRQTLTDCNCDVVIVVASGGSTDPGQWVPIKDAVEILVRDYRTHMGPSAGQARMALIRYAGEAEVISGLTWDYKSLENADFTMNNVQGPPSLTAGLAAAYKELFNSSRADPSKCKSVKLILDRKAADPAEAIKAARKLKTSGVSIYVVGVQGSLEESDLQVLASPVYQKLVVVHPTSENGFSSFNFTIDVNNYELVINNFAIRQAVHTIGDRCRANTLTLTPNAFVYDACACDYMFVYNNNPDQLSTEQFETIRTFIARTVHNLKGQISSKKVRVGLLSYVAITNTDLPLSGDYQQITSAIATIALGTPGMGAVNNLYKGINDGYLEFDKANAGFGNCRRMIVIDEGFRGDCTDRNNVDLCRNAAFGSAHLVKSIGKVHLQYYLVNSAPDVTDDMLGTLVNSPATENTRRVEWNQFNELADSITLKCQPVRNREYREDCQSDTVLLLDTSNTLTADLFAKIKTFCTSYVAAIMNRVGIDQGITILSADGSVVSDCATLTQTSSSISQAFYHASDILTRSDRGKKVVKFVVGSPSLDPKSEIAAAEHLKQVNGILVQVIAVGSAPNNYYATAVASVPTEVNSIFVMPEALEGEVTLYVGKCDTSTSQTIFAGPKSQCNTDSYNTCFQEATDACGKISKSSSCSADNMCSNMFALNCATVFKGADYAQCDLSPCTNLKSTCNAQLYSTCVDAVNAGSDEACLKTNRLILCALATGCPDLSAKYCGASAVPDPNCPATACNTFSGQKVSVNDVQLGLPYAMQRQPRSNKLMIALTVASGVVASAIVVMIVKYRRAVAEESQTVDQLL